VNSYPKPLLPSSLEKRKKGLVCKGWLVTFSSLFFWVFENLHAIWYGCSSLNSYHNTCWQYGRLVSEWRLENFDLFLCFHFDILCWWFFNIWDEPSTNLSPHTDYAMRDAMWWSIILPFFYSFLASGPKGRNVFSMSWLVGQIGNLPLPSTPPTPPSHWEETQRVF